MPKIITRRSDSTRAELMSAFTRLVFANGFENVSVRDVVRTAGFARSTFYEHFSDKEDVLRASMNFLFEVVADCVTADTPPEELHKVLGHLWSNRRLTDAIFSGHARKILSRNQTDLVEHRLREMEMPATISLRLAAIQLAEGQLALIENWLRGRAFAKVEDVAATLHRTSRASALATVQP